MGCYERTLAWLIEKYAGKFPTWLCPEQVRVLPISDKYEAYAAENGAADSDALKADYMIKHLDKQKCYELDEDLMQQILHFYDSCCGYESSRYNLAPCAGTVSTSTPSKTSFSPLQSSAAPCTASIPACPANCSTSLRQHESI